MTIPITPAINEYISKAADTKKTYLHTAELNDRDISQWPSAKLEGRGPNASRLP